MLSVPVNDEAALTWLGREPMLAEVQPAPGIRAAPVPSSGDEPSHGTSGQR